jgi:outer membrane lipoprotein SlyB
MRVLKIALVMSTLLAGAACQREAQQPQRNAADLAWLDSLALYPPSVADSQAVASPEELSLTTAADAKAAPEHTVSHATHSSSSRSSSSGSSHRSSSSGSSSSGSSAGTVARQPRVTTVKHTKRDAAIGAAGGAIVGAVVGGSKHRVRNGAIGAVAGGVLGAVLGNNVDKGKRVEY